jgi:methylmalonyl-CoA mutase cobalamin-binding subunit
VRNGLGPTDLSGRDGAWEYLHCLDPLLTAFRERNLDVPIVVGGSVVTEDDARAIETRGVAAAFGPTADTAEIVATIERLSRGSTA